MLLAFFIVLNVLSNFEEAKARPVLTSILKTFSNEDATDQRADEQIPEDPLDAFREADSLDELERLFRAQITGVEVKTNRLGTLMHMRMRVDRFEKGFLQKKPIGAIEGSRLNAQGFFLPTLISLLNGGDDIPYRMDMVMNVKRGPAEGLNMQPLVIKEKIEKVSSYANTLEEAGLPKILVSSGLGTGPEDTIDIFFRRHVPFNPLGEGGGEL